ncbi:MAG: hypothetical protein HC803_06285 [Saprospiraceae bacterium]|nr:hypothetical protein [Saprospiraceae bacterium]
MNDKKITEAILAVTVGMLIIHFLFDVTILSKFALGVGLIGLFIKPFAKWIAWSWYKLSEALGYVNSRILLSLVFFLALVPIALISRLFTKGDLQLKRKKDSYYSDRNHKYAPKDFENVW